MSPSGNRRHLHTRTVQFDGYLRDDGLWDIEAELRDIRSYASEGYDRGELPAGELVHHIAARVTIDDDMIVRDVAFEMKAIPFHYCAGAAAHPQDLVGSSLSRGWRKSVDARMKGTLGCSHLRELLYGLPTAAMQVLTPYRETFMKDKGAPKGPNGEPFYLNGCYSWSFEGPIVARFLPEFSGRKPESSK